MQEEKTETGVLADETAVPEEPEVPAAVEEPDVWKPTVPIREFSVPQRN